MTTAKGGAPRKPTALKILEGSDLTHPERMNRREPKVRTTPVVKPVGMGKDAGIVWDRIMEAYGESGMITSLDVDVLRAYCDAVVRYDRAQRQLDRTRGSMIRTSRGDRVKNPLHQVVRDNATMMLRLARELGFTPSARAGLQTPDEGDELDAWARGH